jgi:hypothetical protein
MAHIFNDAGPKVDMALVGHADASRHVPLNTRKLPVLTPVGFITGATKTALLPV